MIIEELSDFEGIWNNLIQFDNVDYMNFKTQMPY